MKDDTLDLEEFKQIFSDLPEYDEDDIEQDSSYDEAQKIADWFNQGLEDSDEEIDNKKTEELEHNWQQRIWEIVNNGAIEFGDLVNCIPRYADFDKVNKTLYGLQEMDVEVILSNSHKKEKASLKEELKKLSQDSNNKAVRTFLNEISHYPFLKKREEWILIFLAQHGNFEARNRVVQSYMQYVVNMARNYIDAGLPFIDLVQEGCLGLIKAIGKYDPSQSNRLYHYAHWWIRQRINRAISQKSRLIRLPVAFDAQIEKLEKVCQQIENQLGREATISEIIKASDINQYEAEDVLLWMNSSFVSLSETYEEDERYDEIIDNPLSELIPEITISELLGDEIRPLPEEQLLYNAKKELLEEVLGTLKDRESMIIRLRFGIEDGTEHTLAEIGEKLGISRERVRQIESEALRKLRHPTRKKNLVELFEGSVEEISDGDKSVDGGDISESTESKVESETQILQEKNTESNGYTTENTDEVISDDKSVNIEFWEERQKKHEEEVQLVFDWFMENTDEK